MSSVFVLGIAGGSGSGKTYFAQALLKLIGTEDCALIYQDNYYIDQSHRFDFDGGSVNFDHPQSLDFDLLGQHLSILKTGKEVDIPLYDFKTHKRLKETLHRPAKRIILVDGILILSAPQVRAQFTESIFVDTVEDLRFERRLKRDVEERGRTPEGVRNQFYKQVKPMHDEFVEPSKKFATYLLKDRMDFDQVLNQIAKKLKDHI